MAFAFEGRSHAIYGVGKLSSLYREFTRQTVFNTARKFCVKPSMGGSFFGNARDEAILTKKSFRAIASVFHNTDDEIKGVLPVGKLLYFKADNQARYQKMATRYFNLVKYRLIEVDKKSNNDVLWCFFPMYWTEKEPLIFGEISAFVIWFERPPLPSAKILELVV
jgi:hypothetical protein